MPLRSQFQLTRSRGAWLTWFWILCSKIDFNSHAHVERDLSDSWWNAQILYFNSHAHVERDGSPCANIGEIERFQLTRSRGAWLCKRSWQICWQCISTHTLTWSVTAEAQGSARERQFQLTRSRGAWPVHYSGLCYKLVISTHTLTWSVTGYAPWAGRGERISTHTLTWSVTRRECLCKECILISTHTLTWSVTIWRCRNLPL